MVLCSMKLPCAVKTMLEAASRINTTLSAARERNYVTRNLSE